MGSIWMVMAADENHRITRKAKEIKVQTIKMAGDETVQKF